MNDQQKREGDTVLALLGTFARHLARDPHDAQDLAQVTLAKLWIAWDSDVTAEWEDAQFSAWFYRIMKNAWIDTTRKRATRTATELSDLHMATGTFEKGVEQREQLKTAMAHLPEQQRVMLSLATQGYTYDEIAKREHIRTSAVNSRVNRARKAFKNAWKETA